jgi:hypothetical protein
MQGAALLVTPGTSEKTFVTLNSSVFANNSAATGAAMFFSDSGTLNASIYACNFTNNSA